MKKFFKILTYLFIGAFVVVGGLLGYVKVALPNTGDAPDLTIKATPERINRGEYLANHVAVCMDCHSTRDWQQFAGPITPGTNGKGGEKFDQTLGFPGKYHAPNLTPYHLKNWTDGELYRAITTGVSKNGHALFPVMGYLNYGKMDTEDVYSIIAYIRTLPEIKNDIPRSKSDFPMNFIINTIPTKAAPTKLPAETDQLAYGKYLTISASCGDCHTKMEKGEPIKGMEFAGGFEFKLPSGMTRSANITPDPETGIGKWTKQQFVDRFKVYADSAYKPAIIGKTDFQTVMPWNMYAGMKTSDIEAIYTYLKTLKPVKNEVIKFEATTK